MVQIFIEQRISRKFCVFTDLEYLLVIYYIPCCHYYKELQFPSYIYILTCRSLIMLSSDSNNSEPSLLDQ